MIWLNIWRRYKIEESIKKVIEELPQELQEILTEMYHLGYIEGRRGEVKKQIGSTIKKIKEYDKI